VREYHRGILYVESNIGLAFVIGLAIFHLLKAVKCAFKSVVGPQVGCDGAVPTPVTQVS